MDEMFTRSRALIGDEATELLARSHVAVFGVGGVGGNAAEALVRGGVGTVTLVDAECFDISNCNRQIFATSKTVGRVKVDAAKERLLDIWPECKVRTYSMYFGKDAEPDSLFEGVDYIIDAIDSVPSKILLYHRAKEFSIPIIASMGTGNKADPTKFRVADIYKTSVCPLAKSVRNLCRKEGIESLKVVYSEELPISSPLKNDEGKPIPASLSFVPGVAGMILAGEVIKDLIKHVYYWNR